MLKHFYVVLLLILTLVLATILRFIRALIPIPIRIVLFIHTCTRIFAHILLPVCILIFILSYTDTYSYICLYLPRARCLAAGSSTHAGEQLCSCAVCTWVLGCGYTCPLCWCLFQSPVIVLILFFLSSTWPVYSRGPLPLLVYALQL